MTLKQNIVICEKGLLFKLYFYFIFESVFLCLKFPLHCTVKVGFKSVPLSCIDDVTHGGMGGPLLPLLRKATKCSDMGKCLYNNSNRVAVSGVGGEGW